MNRLADLLWLMLLHVLKILLPLRLLHSKVSLLLQLLHRGRLRSGRVVIQGRGVPVPLLVNRSELRLLVHCLLLLVVRLLLLLLLLLLWIKRRLLTGSKLVCLTLGMCLL